MPKTKKYLNINRSVDPCYRYKMPSVETEYVNEYTYISNLEQVAYSLKRRPMDILKYLGIKFGTIANNNSKKKGKGNGYGIKGKYTTEIIQENIFSFINRFVICYNCKNPETYFIVKNKKKISKMKMKCMSCCESYLFDTSLISKYDKKVVNYICSNPPELPQIVQKTQGNDKQAHANIIAPKILTVNEDEDEDAFSDLDDDYFSNEAQEERLNKLGGIFAKKKPAKINDSNVDNVQEEEKDDDDEVQDFEDDDPFQQLTSAEIAIEQERLANAAIEAKELDNFIEGL